MGNLSFSPDGAKLAVTNGGAVSVFSTACAPGSCSAIFGANINPNSNASFSSNSQLLAVNYNAQNSSGRIRIYNTSNTAAGWSQNNDYVITQNGYNISYGTRLAFAPDNTLASAGSQITLSNVGNGSLIRNLTPIAYSPVPSLSFSADGQTLATINYNSVSSGDSIQLWNVADGSRRNVSFPQSIGLLIKQIFITPNQKIVTLDNTANPNKQHVKFWNAVNGSLIRSIQLNTPFGDAVISVSSDGQTYSILDGHTSFYRTSDDSLIRTLQDDGGTGAFSPNGQLFVSGQVTQSGNFNKIKIFDVSTGTELRTLNLSAILSRYSPNVAFSPDGQTIAVIEEVNISNNYTGIIELFRVSDGTLLRTLGTFNSFGATVAFAPDGQTVIGTGYDTTVRIWRVSDGALLETYNQETGVGTNVPLYQVVYSPDGSRFAYGRRDATVVMARNPYPTTPPTAYTISGNVSRNGSALVGVSVALSGSASETMTTDGGGNYSFSVTDGGSYTVTPTLTGNNFAPASQSFNFIAGNQTANFTASLVTHTISGNITRSGTALSGVNVNLSGSTSGSTTTDTSGNYSLTVSEGGNYTVTPALAGNVFTPTSRNFNNVTTDQTGNFTALFSTYTISGNVKADGANLAGAFVSLNGTQTQTTTTDTNGNYTFTANTYGNYTVTASKNGYLFAPANQTFNNLQANQTANFQNGTPLCAPAPSNLTAWYQGEGSALDSSGNGINGTLNGSVNGGATFGAGKVGQAFSFDGVDDRVTIPDAPSNSPTSALTLNAWIKPTRINQQQIFISKYNNFTSQDAFSLNSDATGSKLEFRVYQTGDSGGSYKVIETANSVLSVNVWTHIAATFDTGTQAMKIYVNGVDTPTIVTFSNGIVTSIFDGIEPIRLGDFINGAGNHVSFFQGLIDEAQIYNRALSQTEIQNIYNAGSAGVCLVSSFTGGGLLDTTFGAGGKVVTPIRNGEDVARGNVIQSDGKIIVVGGSSNGSNQDFAIARYNADGSLDNSFGTNGKVTTPIGSSDDEAFSAAIQTDGKIVVSGYSISGDANFALVRYNTNGSLDSSFGTNGKVTTAASSIDDYALGVAIQADGKIVAGGFGRFGSNDDFLVVRYNTNGSLDTAFGANGIRHMAVGSSFDNGSSVAIQTDGKIILAGYTAVNSQYDFGIVRYNTDGSEDASFGSGGIVTTVVGGNDFAGSVAIQTNGKIVVVGDTENGSNRDFAAVRYNADGSLDTTFGTNGRVITPIGNGLDIARSVKIQSDGKIVAAGVSSNGSNDDFAVVRYTTNGALDTNFGAGGKVTTAIGNANDGGNAVALQSDGNIVVAGYSYNGANNDFAVVRYNTAGSVASQGSVFTPNGTGSFDTTFGNDGKVITPIGTGNDVVNSTAVQSDGKIVVVGNTNNSATANDFAVARYNANGSLDPSFGNGGKVITDFVGGNDTAYGVAIQSDGKIVAVGSAFNGSVERFALARYNSDGSLDTTFAVAGKVLESFTTNVYTTARSVAIQPDGKIVAAGVAGVVGSPNYNMFIARYNIDGSYSGGYGIGYGSVSEFTSVAIQPDGKIVVVGYYNNNSNNDFVLIRFNSELSNYDFLFGTPIGFSNDVALSVAIQSDGKIVAAGYTFNGSNYDFALVRYNTDGSLDTTFGTGGKITTPINSADDYAQSLAIQADGKIVVAGYSNVSGHFNSDFALVRYNTNGSLDNSFGTNGKSATEFGVIRSIAIQSNGGIVAAGYTNNGSNNDFALARYNANSGSVSIAPLNNLNLTFSNVTQAGNTVATPLTASQLPALPTGYILPANAPMYDIRTSAGYSGSLTVSFNVPNITSSAVCAGLRSLHYENGAWTTATNAVPSYNSAAQSCTVSQTVTSLSPFVVAQQFAPTAASVTIGGRVLTATGGGIKDAIITLTDLQGNARTTKTGKLGAYRFRNVAAGETYIISVSPDGFTFSQPAQVRFVGNDLTDVNFIALED